MGPRMQEMVAVHFPQTVGVKLIVQRIKHIRT
jgi:hypothetical protein